MFGILRSLFGRSTATEIEDEVIGGADAVFNAILEHAEGEQRYFVTYGEPELIDRGGEFTTDFMVRVPTSTGPGEPEPPNIEYNLPEGEDKDADLFQLLDAYGIETVADLGDLQGEAVMASFEDGTLSLRFDLLEE